MLRNTEEGYGLVAIVLHWSMAVVVIVLFALGLWMVDLTYYDPWYRRAPDIHKGLGVLLAITLGLADDPPTAVARMVALVEETGRRHGIKHPMQMTVATTNGKRVWAFRYSSEGDSRSLFHSTDVRTLRRMYPDTPVVLTAPGMELDWVEVEGDRKIVPLVGVPTAERLDAAIKEALAD